MNCCTFQCHGIGKDLSGQWLCGSVGRTVASDTRGLRFESSHQQIYWAFVYCQLCIEKTKIKKKEAGNGPFLKSLNLATFLSDFSEIPLLELSLSCDNLLCDALGRAPSAKLIVTFRNNRSVAYWRHLAQTEVAEVKSIKLGQLLGWSLLTPEVCSLNPVMINFHLQSIQSNKTIKITKRDPYSFEK